MPILSSHFDNQPINIIDIGTSAGLTLGLDQYEYHYNDTYFMGESSVKVKSKTKVGRIPKTRGIVTINTKIGIDQNPLIGSAIFHVLGVFLTSCTCIVKSRRRGCFPQAGLRSLCSPTKNRHSLSAWARYGCVCVIFLKMLRRSAIWNKISFCGNGTQ